LLFGEKKSLTGRRAEKGEILFKKKGKIVLEPLDILLNPTEKNTKKIQKNNHVSLCSILLSSLQGGARSS